MNPQIESWAKEAILQEAEGLTVIGRFHNNTEHFLLIWTERRANFRQAIGKPPGVQNLVGIVGDHHKAVVRMKVYAAK